MWSFVKDLQEWRTAEKLFAKYLIDYPNFISLEFSQWRFPDWDIRMVTKDKVITYEIKKDLQAQDTWNVAIEVSFKWDASWIFSSKADYVVYTAAWRWWIQKRGELILRLIKAEKRELKWWDWRNSLLWLVKLSDMDTLFEPLNLYANAEEDGAEETEV
jgi:hypothetical protein